MNKKVKLICYGAGAGFKDFQIHLYQTCAEIVGVIDKNAPLGGRCPPIATDTYHRF